MEKKFKDKEFVCIRISRTWGGTQMRPEFKKRTYKDYLLLREAIESEPENFELREQAEQKHLAQPILKFSEGDFGYSPEDAFNGVKVPVVAEMHFTYNRPFHMQRKSSFGKVIFAILMFLTAVIVFNIYIGIRSENMSAIRAQCIVFTEYGIPQFMTIGELSKYNLKPNGDVADEDKVFVNPWFAETVETKEGCKYVELKN